MDTALTQSWSHRIGTDPVLVYPDGCMDLVFDGETVSVAGADTGPRFVSRRPGDLVSGVRFAPGVLPAVLGVPAGEFTDRTVPLADVSPALAQRLRTPQDAQAAASVAVESWIGPAVLALSRGERAAQTADLLGLSERQLHRRCVSAFGYGPRKLQVILRAGDAIEMLRGGLSLSDAATAAAYADYPHLYRDIVRLTGRRPAEFSPAP
ncbi:helix-turn-helix domain-containing protein [Gordonia sp. HY002]|uniref:helix-turn-helix domain-containing protein n=1 Tax=Gordonia zhenghanii TaxID=2911516 RepID=UPI001EF0710F|nr:helix-turn-helix domain-containing protein [Gordonia zhenghanii]MCF8568972.1 helix-turn-helix domain-containing protein [Gordonia zhenghanii]MCF8608474.1 helix-turn-helix domain-containing protein [Gordonia zhenghanii]